MRSLATRVLALLCFAAMPATAQPVQNDLRVFRVGMPATELPGDGYADFTCAGSVRKPLTAWNQFRDCAADAAGLHQVSFRYDDNPDHDTTVAGQPVLLALGIGDDGVVRSITIRSDPTGRVFNRKRGAHFGERAMAQYGEKGWSCRNIDPARGEVPIGNTFVHEHCEKTIGDRHLVVERALFRDAGEAPDKFTSTSSLMIALVSPDAK